MKKWMAMLLSCVLALNLAACGAGADGGPEDSNPAETALHFELTTSVYEDEYKADDGTVLFSERYELPQLELRDESGDVYTLAENVTANGGAGETAQLRVQAAFNTEMESVLTSLRADAGKMTEEAKELYAAGTDWSMFTTGGSWTSELTLGEVYRVEGKLLSIAAEEYTYYGGPHPNSASRTWNFDLTSGEFLTFDDLASQEGDVNGNTLQERIYWSIASQIGEQNLNEGYFDDYDSYLLDFPSFAALRFTAAGMTVTFDNYIIAPYAAGPQVFEVPYDAFYSALSEHAKELLDVSQEQIVLSDFDTAAALWAWFHMLSPACSAESGTVEIGGYTYWGAEISGVSTMSELRALLCRYFDASLADEWLAEEPARFAEEGGRLYVLDGARGSDIDIIGDTRSVTLEGETGVVTQVITRRDPGGEDPGGEETIEYPFTLVDGHAVFSAFPYPY